MRHDLLGYLLGALDGCEHDTIRQQLTVDAELRQQLLELEHRLTALERQRTTHEPPAHLSESTCRLIAQHVAASRAADVTQTVGSAHGPAAGRAAAALSPVVGPRATQGEWSLVDMVIAAGIFLAAAFLFLPTIWHSHNVALAQRCQENQRCVAQSMVDYSSLHSWLPTPMGKGYLNLAGYIPAKLADDGFIEQRWLICPASELATTKTTIPVLSCEELAECGPDNLPKIAAMLNASYCFPIGHAQDRKYVPARTTGSPYLALLSDLPSMGWDNAGFSHHSKNHINVVFHDLSIRELPTGSVVNPDRSTGDNIFLNDSSEIAPGLHPNDAVIVPGMKRPDFSRVVIRLGIPKQLENHEGQLDGFDVLLESETQ